MEMELMEGVHMNGGTEQDGAVTPTPLLDNLASLLPPLNTPLKQRADILSLKLRLGSLLPPSVGQLYWSSLSSFLTGRITRTELSTILASLLRPYNPLATKLHNALLLGILFNTTRLQGVPVGVRHGGWGKRRRDEGRGDDQYEGGKRRKVKEVVMSLGKRERAELKSLVALKKDPALALSAPISTAMDATRGTKLGKDGLPSSFTDVKDLAAVQTNYLRMLQTPLCCESKLLPDAQQLQDRMSLIAYEYALEQGADSTVAQFGVMAVEQHLRSMLTAVIALVRSSSSSGGSQPLPPAQPPLTSSSSSTSMPPPTSPSKESSLSQQPEITLTSVTLPSAPTTLLPSPPPPPLSSADFNALFEIAPHLFVLPHVGAVEKLWTLPSTIGSSEGESETEDSSDEGPGETEGGGATGGKSRSNSRNSRSNSGNVGGGGREQYLIDPSSIPLPNNHHPDVRPIHPRMGSLSLPSPSLGGSPSPFDPSSNGLPHPNRKSSLSFNNGRSSSGGNGTPTSIFSSNPIASTSSSQQPSSSSKPLMSPKSLQLRNKLFPELDDSPSFSLVNPTNNNGGIVESPAPMALNLALLQSPSLEDTSDGGSDSDEGVGPNVAGVSNGAGGAQVQGVKIKLGGTKGKREKDKQGRKLWEVVDSGKLLDGVLD